MLVGIFSFAVFINFFSNLGVLLSLSSVRNTRLAISSSRVLYVPDVKMSLYDMFTGLREGIKFNIRWGLIPSISRMTLDK